MRANRLLMIGLVLLLLGVAAASAADYIGAAKCKMCHKVQFASWESMGVSDALPEVLTGWSRGEFTHDGRTRAVYRRGSGPGVLIMHEVPGLHPKCQDRQYCPHGTRSCQYSAPRDQPDFQYRA